MKVMAGAKEVGEILGPVSAELPKEEVKEITRHKVSWEPREGRLASVERSQWSIGQTSHHALG